MLNGSSENQVQHIEKVYPEYDVERFISQGAMGEVWLLSDSSKGGLQHGPNESWLVGGQRFAAKISRHSFDANLEPDRAYIQLVLDEAEIFACCNHPNILKVKEYAVAEDDYGKKLPIIIMEYLNGNCLRDTSLAELGLKSEQIFDIFSQIASGIDYLHNVMNVLHRDIKPENIVLHTQETIAKDNEGKTMYRANGEPVINRVIIPKLIDGVFVDLDADIADFKKLTGTPGYISQEYIRNEIASKTSDRWAFAATIYQSYVGALPFGFSDDPFKTLERVTNKSNYTDLTPENCKVSNMRVEDIERVNKVLRSVLVDEKDFESCEALVNALRGKNMNEIMV